MLYSEESQTRNDPNVQQEENRKSDCSIFIEYNAEKWTTNACNIDESEKACLWEEEARHKRIDIVWFYLYDILE